MLFLLTLEVLTERSPVTAVTAALGVGSTTSVAASACYLPHTRSAGERTGRCPEKQTVFARSRLFQSQLHPSQLSLSNSQSSLQQSRLTQSQLCHLQTLFQQCRLTQSHLSQSQCQVDHSQSRLRQAQFDESIVAQLRADVEDLKRTVRTTLRSTRAGGGALRGPTTRKFSTTSLERDYQLEFDCSWTMSPAHPLPPKPLKPSVSAQLHTVEAQAAAQESKSKEPLEDVDAPTKNMRHFC
ncbi:hypothetical protein PF010_g22996 [Phytophthora fragariae]|uniref:Uncharacterized protein n=1 Tax=Phytophthora fragariae TaxID=53985 RepID=A0A6G0K7P8_9STRA|nr:hypothetical protein PF010_g22996 [Phytophthora fragariae]